MTSKYPYVLTTQFLMLTIDIFFNALSILCYGDNMALLLIYILQDTLLIMSSLVLFVSFTATFVFQLGLIHIVLVQFLPTIIMSIFYTFVSIGYHYTSLSSTWEDQTVNIFLETHLLIFFIFHKVISCIFYSFYKRTALQISDPKYNSDSTWLRELFIKHMNDKAAKLEARNAAAAT
ncbi:Protein CBG00740 [Caenorhabditis briggsae]|uniref:Transmembrane protein 138 n=3 Tax=Caenorhabditis briggsae TaxID=6238 RepID=A0AAE9E696_CAEBR|nr:Protein CBG00740 [Caenorhabditis briggsae]ULU04342.1 hypothetical protein L3Y34_017249 [Caenorhabditis briggsae]UMM16346.1 hypothetical protein L5515_013391 [Caenorhabditis briggsae]CAP21918.1 Protein CBG00740 [Caenorhabditis briggsae]